MYCCTVFLNRTIEISDKIVWLGGTWNEPQCEKTYLLTCAPNEDSDQPARPRSLIRVFVVRMKKTLHPWLSKMCPVKILIRLRECAGWSESSLGAQCHIQRYVFWCCGSLIFCVWGIARWFGGFYAILNNILFRLHVHNIDVQKH